MMETVSECRQHVRVPRLAGLEFQSKASSLRALVSALQKRGFLSRVMSRCSPETVALLKNPPSSSGWVSGRTSVEVSLAIAEIGGTTLLQDLGRETTRESASTVLRPLVEGFLRLFGLTPLTLFSRLDTFAGQTSKGISFRFEEKTARSGVVVIVINGATDVPVELFWSLAGSLLYTYDLCGIKGTMSDPVVRAVDRNSECRVTYAW